MRGRLRRPMGAMAGAALLAVTACANQGSELEGEILDDPDFVAGRVNTGFMERLLARKEGAAAS